MDTTEEASADQYGLDQETLDKLLDRSDIVKVKSSFECQICTQVHHITILKKKFLQEWKEKGGILKKEEDYAKMKSGDTLDNGMAPYL
jgi:hypothetical protein